MNDVNKLFCLTPSNKDQILDLSNSKSLEDEKPSIIDFNLVTDSEIVDLLLDRTILLRNLEKTINDYERCVLIRRKYYQKLNHELLFDGLPYQGYAYDKVFGQCCENVIGWVGIPVGCVGPLILNGLHYYVPMATTEGCLVASASRGASCIRMTKGITGVLIDDGMTRAPVLRSMSVVDSLNLKKWIENDDNFKNIKLAFDSTSRFAKLREIKSIVSGRFIFLRFKCHTGEAMGMNMISKGVEAALSLIMDKFGSCIEILSISGNCCADKKAAAINWIEGRGKSVVCEVEIPLDIAENILKVSSQRLVELNIAKNLVGSAHAGVVGGYNAHAANIVAAIFAATGQDIAQVVESSSCLTFMEIKNNYLYISCTMPCIEVGTIGGGTILPAQRSCIDMMKLERCGPSLSPSGNFALVICASVLCAELSLMAALCSGTLVSSHLSHNRGSSNFISGHCQMI